MLVGFVLWFASGLTGFIIDLTGGVVQNDCPIEGFRYDTSQITPHTQAITGYTDLIINGANLEQLLPNIAVLPGFTAVFLSVAIFRLKCDYAMQKGVVVRRFSYPLGVRTNGVNSGVIRLAGVLEVRYSGFAAIEFLRKIGIDITRKKKIPSKAYCLINFLR